MSLFIAPFAFSGQPLLAEQARMGILPAPVLSPAAGYAVLRFAAAADKGSPDLESARASD